jgi:hypothetical protein
VSERVGQHCGCRKSFRICDAFHGLIEPYLQNAIKWGGVDNFSYEYCILIGMDSIGKYLETYQPAFFEKTDWEKRQDALKEIWNLYDSATEDRLRKLVNWRLFSKWCAERRFDRKNPLAVDNFKRSSTFRKKMTIKLLAIKLSHIKTSKDMYYILSICRDRHNRNQSIGAYIFGATKVQPYENV